MWVQIIEGGMNGWEVMGEFRIVNGALKAFPFPGDGNDIWFENTLKETWPDAGGRMTVTSKGDPQDFLEALARQLRGTGVRALLLDDDDPGHFQKMTQEDVEFEHPGKSKDKCADCIFYFGEGDACALVEGVVMPEDWCNGFSLTEARTLTRCRL